MKLKRILIVTVVCALLLTGCENRSVQDLIDKVENEEYSVTDSVLDAVEHLEDKIEEQMDAFENESKEDPFSKELQKEKFSNYGDGAESKQDEESLKENTISEDNPATDEPKETGLTENKIFEEKTFEDNTSSVDITNKTGSEQNAQSIIPSENAYLYYYNLLTETEQTVYNEVLDSLLKFKQDTKVSTLDAKLLDKVFQCVINDHPEIFYVTGYNLVTHTLGSKLVGLEFSGTYTMSATEAAMYYDQLTSYVNQCLAGAPSGSDYEKVKYIYEYLIRNTEYNKSAVHNQDILSVFLYGESVCQGYAKATQFLLNRLQIKTTLVAGTVRQGSHVWNLVLVDNDYYYVDTTWGDASYRILDSSGQEIAGKTPEINYDYLCVTTDMLKRTHRISNFMPMPTCNHMENYYFVKEGLYFSEPDYDRIQALFDRAYETGASSVTLKCKDATVLKQMCTELINNSGIFQYLKDPEQGISYTMNTDSNEICFWL